MPNFRSLPKPLLAVPATMFALAVFLYSSLWIVYGGRPVPVELGFDNKHLGGARCEFIQGIVRDSPAERAGLQRGDCILSAGGTPLDRIDSVAAVWLGHSPGDQVELVVQRPGASSPVIVHATYRATRENSSEAGIAQHVGQDINILYPVAFLIVGLAVLFLRLDDPNAWLLALLFAGFIAIPGFSVPFPALPVLPNFAGVYRDIFNNLVAALFYFFFAVFPSRSPLDRRLPALKWLALALAAALAVPMLPRGNGVQAPGEWLTLGPGHILVLIFNYGLIVLGFASLLWNARSVSSAGELRKIRVILWGTLVGVVPAVLTLAANDFAGFHSPTWLSAIVIVFLWFFPLSFAYAVVKHRVLEIPVLLRRSARYLLVQRGFVLVLILLSAVVTIGFALVFARYLQPLTQAALPGAIGLGTVFGTVLLWSGARIHKDVGQRIDRAFFRSAYDARLILEDLVEKTRTVVDRPQLAALLEHHLTKALQPTSLIVYLETGNDQLAAMAGRVPPPFQTIASGDPALERLARHGRPWEFSANPWNGAPLFFTRLQPDCLVPILGRDGRLVGLVALGPRLSEEPYSTEDKRLLALAANQAAVALESIRLGEKIAERIEAERRASQELEFARQVQTRLFPQNLPALQTLAYTGTCLPARTVGGDYYDFLELRPGRLALVVADIAGKGVPGAMLMANLQANLRSQYAMALDDLPRLLASVNRLFYQTTNTANYATLFFADYDDHTRLLRYANCGHLPALLLRADSSSTTASVEWLGATATVLGLFEQWRCEVAEVQLGQGDMLVLYTDGITEAANTTGEEFGELRLRETVSGGMELPVTQLQQRVLDAVVQFSQGKQEDDITIVIAQSRT